MTSTVFSLFCFSIFYVVYFGENNHLNVLKSLNIGHIINITLSFQFVVSILNFTRYFHKK